MKFHHFKFVICQFFCICLYHKLKTNIMKAKNEKIMNQIEHGSASELLDAYSNLITINHLYDDYKKRMRQLFHVSSIEELIENAKKYLIVQKIRRNKDLSQETQETLSTLKKFGYGY